MYYSGSSIGNLPLVKEFTQIANPLLQQVQSIYMGSSYCAYLLADGTLATDFESNADDQSYRIISLEQQPINLVACHYCDMIIGHIQK